MSSSQNGFARDPFTRRARMKQSGTLESFPRLEAKPTSCCSHGKIRARNDNLGRIYIVAVVCDRD
jgi:hypothetical protein